MKDYDRRQRVLDAVNHIKPDRTPTDFQAVSEIWERVMAHLGVDSMKGVLDRLEIDCAWIDPEVSRKSRETDSEGYIIGWGGSKMRQVANQYGVYDEIVHYVLEGVESEAEVDERLSLPDLSEWDFDAVEKNCLEYDDRFLLGGFASCFYYPTLIMSLEEFLVNAMINPALAHHIIKRCFDWHMEYHEKLLKRGHGRIDAMQIADDYATQRGLMMDKDMFNEFFRKPMEEFVALAKSYGAIPFQHCCGSSYHLIPDFIDIGIKILDPIQTVAANMEPDKLKAEFGNDLTFHGAGETQHILPQGTEEEVKANARFLSDTLGKGGGYILTSCHFLQADVPVDNIIAFYDTENR